MLRRFQFEGEIHDSLSCVPMGARRKLDRIGLKLSLAQWQGLGRGERLMICHAPVKAEDECEALRTFIEEATLARCATRPALLDEQSRRDADPPAAPPEMLRTNAQALGVALTPEMWTTLDEDERYALIKLSGGTPSRNLKAALEEIIALHGARPARATRVAQPAKP